MTKRSRSKKTGRRGMTLSDLVRVVSAESKSDEEVVAVVADLINRRRIRFGGMLPHQHVQIV